MVRHTPASEFREYGTTLAQYVELSPVTYELAVHPKCARLTTLLHLILYAA
jgi:hypothetical protein